MDPNISPMPLDAAMANEAVSRQLEQQAGNSEGVLGGVAEVAEFAAEVALDGDLLDVAEGSVDFLGDLMSGAGDMFNGAGELLGGATEMLSGAGELLGGVAEGIGDAGEAITGLIGGALELLGGLG